MERTRIAVEVAFPYLVSKGRGNVPRFVSQLDFHTFDFEHEFLIENFYRPNVALPMQALRLEHGEGYDCAGFLFGSKDKVAYLSDVSFVPPETMARLNALEEPLSLLVIDSLRPYSPEKITRPQVHFDLEDALRCVKEFRVPPKRTIIVGMGHEFDYEPSNAILAQLDPSQFGHVECGYDGMTFDFEL